jgi:hypothetical protein
VPCRPGGLAQRNERSEAQAQPAASPLGWSTEQHTAASTIAVCRVVVVLLRPQWAGLPWGGCPGNNSVLTAQGSPLYRPSCTTAYAPRPMALPILSGGP